MTNTRIKDEEVLDFNFEMDEEVTEKPKRKKKKVAIPSTKSSQTVEAIALAAIPKLHKIVQEINERVFEREHVILDLMRAVIAGENILLLGPPGTAKSMLAELFTGHITDAQIFKWLMNRTTDPSDIVGPHSLKQMENDRFMRVTTGRAPEAHITFFDEIFKANEPSLNYMLSMLNEGIMYNDGKPEKVEIRIAIGASNEYPESNDLEAFYDRFIFRHWVNYIQDPQNRIAMVESARSSKSNAQNMIPLTMITLEEIDALQKYVHQVQFPNQVAANFDKLYRSLQTKDIHISDRRYYKAQVVMMANALLHGRNTVNGDDFKALTYVLWNKDVKEIEIIAEEVGKYVNPYESKMKDLLKKAIEVKENTLKIENRTERAGEAVQANANLQDILGKMENEINDAKTNGIDTKPLIDIINETENIMEEIAQECLKQSIRGKRNW